MGWVVNDLSWLLYCREYPTTHCPGDWCGKSHPHQLIPSLPYWQWVTVLTTLSLPTLFAVMCAKLFLKQISMKAQINVQIYCCSYITELYTVHYCTDCQHPYHCCNAFHIHSSIHHFNFLLLFPQVPHRSSAISNKIK
jgi:hypothetical protein